MKKSMIALAVLGSFAGAAFAQSSVTLYGRVDLSIAKNAGSSAKAMQNGSGSRLGLRGSEDLGGGMAAIFNIETRFDADTGAAQNMTGSQRFWGARSLVGLKGAFGEVTLGREYTSSFLYSQLRGDPWGWDTVVAGAGTVAITRGGSIGKVRNDSALNYNFAASGFNANFQIAEANDTYNNMQNRPVNFALGYAAGPIAATFGYEKTGFVGAAAEKVMTINGSYNFGAAKVMAHYTKGTTTADASVKGYLLALTAPLGQGELRAGLGKMQTAGVDNIGLIALGYHYSMSKRTTLYADFARNSKLAAEKTAYDFGIKHNF